MTNFVGGSKNRIRTVNCVCVGRRRDKIFLYVLAFGTGKNKHVYRDLRTLAHTATKQTRRDLIFGILHESIRLLLRYEYEYIRYAYR